MLNRVAADQPARPAAAEVPPVQGVMYQSHHVPAHELLTPSFLTRHTRFTSVDALFEASGYEIREQSDLSGLPHDHWDGFIRSVSVFENWHAMLRAASSEWVVRRLGLHPVSVGESRRQVSGRVLTCR